MMLCGFHFKEEASLFRQEYLNRSKDTNETVDFVLIEFKEVMTAKPSLLQIILSFWVFTFFCEEFRQV